MFWSLGDAVFTIYMVCVCDAFIKLSYIWCVFFQGPVSTPYYKSGLCAAEAEGRAFEFMLAKHPGSSVKLSIYYYITELQRITSFQFSK